MLKKQTTYFILSLSALFSYSSYAMPNIGNQPPQVSIITPDNNTTLLIGAPYLIEVAARDLDGSITKVELYNGNAMFQTIDTLPYHFSGSTANLPEGTYTITAKAYDDQNQVTTSNPVVVTLKIAGPDDNAQPTVALSIAQDQRKIVQGDPYSFNVIASDGDGTIDRVEYYYDDNLFNTITTPPYDLSGSTEGVATGNYPISVKAYDNLGGVATSDVINVEVVAPEQPNPDIAFKPEDMRVAINLLDEQVNKYINYRQLDRNSPIFYGHWDWHSSVHGHLARVIYFEENEDPIGLAAFIDDRFEPSQVQAEINFNKYDVYGWAWLMQLDVRLKQNEIDRLSPLANHFSNRLLDHIVNHNGDPATGSYSDRNWYAAGLYQWAQYHGDTQLMAQTQTAFARLQGFSSVRSNTGISEGDFFSKVGITAYAHVVIGMTDTPMYQRVHDIMLAAVTNGALQNFVNQTASVLRRGAVFDHAPGKISGLGYGYWALFQQTKNPAFFHAYNKILKLSIDHADDLGETVATGHWLPNFASFNAGLPNYLIVEDTGGDVSRAVDQWLSDHPNFY